MYTSTSSPSKWVPLDGGGGNGVAGDAGVEDVEVGEWGGWDRGLGMGGWAWAGWGWGFGDGSPCASLTCNLFKLLLLQSF